MTTVATEARPQREWQRAVTDVPSLLALRLAGLRRQNPRGAQMAFAVIAGLTIACAAVPALVPGAATSDRAGRLSELLPSGMLAFCLTTTLAVAVAGGGRELLSRDEGVAFPLSPTTDHLGALLLAPLNLAWLVQAWSLLGVSAYAVGPEGLLAAQTAVGVWLLAATAVAQLIGWCVEWVRRGPAGVRVVRSTGVALLLAGCALVVTDGVTSALLTKPTPTFVLAALHGGAGGSPLLWPAGPVAVGLLALLAVAAGARVAHAVARRPPYMQHRGEGRVVGTRSMPRSVWSALARVDRASVWRSVPLRRGLVTIALLPAVATATGTLGWHLLPVLVGVVAAGGALVFGVNAWCLDGGGALWRDSQPAPPGVVFAARARVLAEVLVGATCLPLLVAVVRMSEAPSSAEAVSLCAMVLVVTLQVVARAMHWSVRRPYAMGLRSARAAPAPPLAMLTYAGYLSLTTTMTAMVFMLTAQAKGPGPALLVALLLVLLGLRRLAATARDWETPVTRAGVVATVAA